MAILLVKIYCSTIKTYRIIWRINLIDNSLFDLGIVRN